MSYRLLLSGDRSTFTTLALDVAKKELRLLADYPAPFNASWVEPVASQESVDRLVGLSEGTESGLLYTFEIDHALKACRTTSQQQTRGAPAHFIMLQDRSAIALATYLGGSIAIYPIGIDEDTGGPLLRDGAHMEILPDFPYTFGGHGPNKDRQRQCHVHQVLEDRQGRLYAPDLGSDRVWILSRRKNETKPELELCGWLQCPPGTGPRHAVLAPDESIMYVLGELSHTILAFDLSAAPADTLPSGAPISIPPIQGFAPNIIPTTVPPPYQYRMDSAEICLHPNISNVIYASNRWERHIAQREPQIQDTRIPTELPAGDAIAILLLSDNGRTVVEIKHVRTNLDVIRGMRLSDDGRYVVLAGQEGGGVEVYEISGERGEVWTPVAGLNEGFEGGLKHAVWL
ncbi:Lactonase, 7-bladed beta-propeller-domain-containing protein [Aspergillus foveolatus]|uniref:Lactonase, 7-bladed beta-propeller-domain-containing protein n=1 Tax=Aspergillus foveolatus TaxID=210207 RepID=UPI003CCCD4F5